MYIFMTEYGTTVFTNIDGIKGEMASEIHGQKITYTKTNIESRSFEYKVLIPNNRLLFTIIITENESFFDDFLNCHKKEQKYLVTVVEKFEYKITISAKSEKDLGELADKELTRLLESCKICRDDFWKDTTVEDYVEE